MSKLLTIQITVVSVLHTNWPMLYSFRHDVNICSSGLSLPCEGSFAFPHLWLFWWWWEVERRHQTVDHLAELSTLQWRHHPHKAVHEWNISMSVWSSIFRPFSSVWGLSGYELVRLINISMLCNIWNNQFCFWCRLFVYLSAGLHMTLIWFGGRVYKEE